MGKIKLIGNQLIFKKLYHMSIEGDGLVIPIPKDLEWQIYAGFTEEFEGIMAYAEDIDWSKLSFYKEMTIDSDLGIQAFDSVRDLSLPNNFKDILNEEVVTFDNGIGFQKNPAYEKIEVSLFTFSRKSKIVAFYVQLEGIKDFSVDQRLNQIDIGKFKTVSEKMIFSDPAYPNEIDDQDQLVVKVASGKEWKVTGYLDSDQLLVKVEGHVIQGNSFKSIEWTKIGQVEVDSAYISVCDYQQHDLDKYESHNGKEEMIASPYFKEMMKLLGDQQEATWENGLIVLSEIGDGEYNIYGKMYEDKLVAFLIDLAF